MKKKEIKNIGVLSPGIANPYIYKLWSAYLELSKKYNVNIFFFIGNELDHPDEEKRNWNFVYELIGEKLLDGVIVLSGAILHYTTLNQAHRFYEKLKGLPLVNVSLKIGNYPAVLTDNKAGMKELVKHFIKVHNKKRIVFITGPKYHFEANERLEAYKEALEENGLSIDPEIILEGDFHPEKALNSIKKFLAKKIEFDAIIGANDLSALAVMEYLQSLGYRIPEDIIIAGYDDSYEARFSIPPLTSVNQPLEKMARRSLEILLDLINKDKVERVVTFNTSLVKRGSCGCVTEEVEYYILSKLFKGETYPSVVDLYNSECEKILNAVSKEMEKEGIESLAGIEKLAGVIEALFYTFSNFSNSKVNSFIKRLSLFLLEIECNEILLKFIDGFFDELRHLIFMRVELSSQLAKEIDKLFKKINNLIFEFSINYFNKLRVEEQRFLEKLHNIIHELVGTHDEAGLRRVLESSLSTLDVGDFSLNLFERVTKKESVPELSRAVCLIKGNKPFELAKEGYIFRTKDLFPKEFLSDVRGKNYLILPLIHRNNRFGFILTEVRRKQAAFYLTLQEQISLNLSTQLLIYEVAEKNFYYKRELEMARNVQLQLLPSSPPNEKIAFFYQPIANVGGDFFYFIESPEKDEITFFICDVAGHGLPAAIITSMIKSYLLQYKRDNFSDPAQFLLYLNNNLAEEAFDQYVTAFMATFNHKTRDFIYCSAGHPMPFLVRKEGVTQLENYNVKSFALGIYCSPDGVCFYNNFTIKLDPATRLVLYTDGLLDWIHNNEYDKPSSKMEREKRNFFKFLLSTYSLSPKDFINKLESKINDSKLPSKYQDDICVICFDS